MPYVEKKVLSGNYIEVVRYRVTRKQLHRAKNKISRLSKKRGSTESRMKSNERRKEIELKRLMHCNFTVEDLFTTFTLNTKKYQMKMR